MSNLAILDHSGIFVVDSREVAEMVDKRHSDLLRDISNYGAILTDANLRSLDFFIPDTYQDAKGENRPRYLLTRKGCDMVANKMTGEKGVLFTAAYVIQFEEMEKQLRLPQPLSQLDILRSAIDQIELAQRSAGAALELAENTQHKIDNIKEALLPADKEWRKYINEQLNKIARSVDSDYQGVREASYKTLETRGACTLARRVKNLKDRLRDQGATKTKINNACRLDVIEGDQRLKEIYTAIVKEMAVKYVA
jgi:Rha family phage regulatory protein